MVEFVETLLYLVHLGTCDSKQRRMSIVLDLFTILSSVKEFLLSFFINELPLLKCFLKDIYLLHVKRMLQKGVQEGRWSAKFISR